MSRNGRKTFAKKRDAVNITFMDILPRLISIAIRKYTARPSDREPAVRMLLRNSVRLAVSHLGHREAASLALAALREPVQ
jgi:hypothetical protein